jgi:hypothetical protein
MGGETGMVQQQCGHKRNPFFRSCIAAEGHSHTARILYAKAKGHQPARVWKSRNQRRGLGTRFEYPLAMAATPALPPKAVDDG